MTIDGENFVTDLHPGEGSGRFIDDVTDDRGAFGFTDGATDLPDDHGEDASEAETEKGTGESDDDFVEGGDGGELFAWGFDLAFHDLHRGELGESDKSPCGDAPETIFDTVDRFLPEGFTEPDAKFFDDQPAPPSGEKVTEFVDDNHQIKDDEDGEDDSDRFDDGEEHRSLEEFGGAGTGPRISRENSIEIRACNRSMLGHDLGDGFPNGREANPPGEKGGDGDFVGGV